jgi:agmatine deiminase
MTTSWRMPAEWEQHERCIMHWPYRPELWGGHFDGAREEYAATANAIAEFEPLTMVVNPGQAGEARRMLASSIALVEIPIDDSWSRDSGPIGVQGPDGSRAGVDFAFNSWGERFVPYDKDAASAEAILAHLGITRIVSPMILEGGSITVDGQGTLITTEQCLLNPNRNPGMTKDQIAAELSLRLGVDTIVWLPWGHFEDKHTDGHVDGVCTFVAPGVVLAQTCEDPANPNFERMKQNMAVLRDTTDAAGRTLEILELSQLPYYDFGGSEDLVSYANFYVANGAVIVPVADHPLDGPALEIIAAAFPGRSVVGVPGRVVSYGGGGVHCITQQVPVAGGAT